MILHDFKVFFSKLGKKRLMPAKVLLCLFDHALNDWHGTLLWLSKYHLVAETIPALQSSSCDSMKLTKISSSYYRKKKIYNIQLLAG